MKKIQAIRGMHDVLPNVSETWSAIERILIDTVSGYGYQEIRFPVVESTELFARSIGESTDIVEKEMYTFLDRSGDSLTLRPEGTACCIRAGIEHGLFYNQIQRLFYYGPMFRHERPQKGRYRQFHQFGVEAYGLAGPDIDLEIMMLAMDFWRKLRIDDQVILQINNLGDKASRAKYREHLVAYFERYKEFLDEDSKRRLATNPLRILDSKNPSLGELISESPKMSDHLGGEARAHFDLLLSMLDQIKLPYRVSPTLVRGLDYYNLTVFEWTVKSQDGLAQNAICAGGHYDSLVAEMGGKATPAIGFALGLERLIALVGDRVSLFTPKMVYFVLLGDKAIGQGMLLASRIRQQSNITVLTNGNGGDLSTQLKRANKSAAVAAIILGEEEIKRGEVAIKYLRDDRPQKNLKFDELDRLLDFI